MKYLKTNSITFFDGDFGKNSIFKLKTLSDHVIKLPVFVVISIGTNRQCISIMKMFFGLVSWFLMAYQSLWVI